MTKIIIPSNFKTKIKYHYPLGKHTWYKIGGNADVFIEPANLEELTEILKILSESNTPVHIFGKGANILIDDDGINGAVISLSNPAFNKWNLVESINHLTIKVGAGCDLFTLVKKTSQQGLDAFTHLTGIPGTIGGAIAMNAGGKWGETFDNLVDITIMSPKGEIASLNKNEVDYGYRKGIKNGSLVLEATFTTNQVEPHLTIKKWRAIFNEKKKKQPLGESSPGCAFQNPLDSKGNRISAGKLIEDCNLKSTCYGEAYISSQHANFLIARPNAPTSDVLHLMKLVQQRVIKTHAIWLDPEVIIWNRH